MYDTWCRMMFLLAKSKRAKDSFQAQKILLKKIKEAISRVASKFGNYRQQVGGGGGEEGCLYLSFGDSIVLQLCYDVILMVMYPVL